MKENITCNNWIPMGGNKVKRIVANFIKYPINRGNIRNKYISGFILGAIPVVEEQIMYKNNNFQPCPL